jgi:hypothetical protein
MRERSKIVYVSNVLHSILEQNMTPTSPIICFLLLKRILNIIENLKKDISVENSSSKYKSLEQWEEFRMTEEYLTFSRYLNEEHEEAVVFLSAYKQEIQNILGDVNDEAVRAQVSNSVVDYKVLCKLLLDYVEKVSSVAGEKYENKDDGGYKRMLLHVNEVLDCVNLDEFFERILVETSLNLNDQSYFSVVKAYSKDKLQEVVQGKITSAKRKL